MSGQSRDPAAEAEADELATSAGFAAGTRVGVEQLGVVDGCLGTHSMGHGELLAVPRVGEPLALRIRGTRGLASSGVRELRTPAPGYLLAATQSSVYLVASAQRLDRAPPEAVSRAAVALVQGLDGRVAAAGGGNVTQYVRLERTSRPGASVVPRGAVFASVERAGESGSRGALGQCDLLSDVVPGAPLRLATADGRVIATSDVVDISMSEAGEFCVATGNSVYVIAPIAVAGSDS